MSDACLKYYLIGGCEVLVGAGTRRPFWCMVIAPPPSRVAINPDGIDRSGEMAVKQERGHLVRIFS